MPDSEDTLTGRLYVSSLTKGDAYFDSISKVIRSVYDVQNNFDQIKFKRSHQTFIGFDETTNKPKFYGGECLIELLDDGNSKEKIYLGDNDSFSDIKRELDRIARKRLAIFIVVFGIAAVLTGVLT